MASFRKPWLAAVRKARGCPRMPSSLVLPAEWCHWAPARVFEKVLINALAGTYPNSYSVLCVIKQWVDETRHAAQHHSKNSRRCLQNCCHFPKIRASTTVCEMRVIETRARATLWGWLSPASEECICFVFLSAPGIYHYADSIGRVYTVLSTFP